MRTHGVITEDIQKFYKLPMIFFSVEKKKLKNIER